MSIDATPLFDPEKLRRHTMGDAAMHVEVLSLFVAEAERLMRQVEEADDTPTRGERLRALVTLSRNIGAMRLVQQARLAEAHVGEEAPDLEGLRSALSDTLAYVRRAAM
jgi:hypothetical protein